MPAYLIANITVKDAEKMDAYAAAAGPTWMRTEPTSSWKGTWQNACPGVGLSSVSRLSLPQASWRTPVLRGR